MKIAIDCAELGITALELPPLNDIVVAVPKQWAPCFCKQHYIFIVEYTLKRNQEIALHTESMSDPDGENMRKLAKHAPSAVLHLTQKPWSKRYKVKWDKGPQDSLATLAKRFKFVSTLPACTNRFFDIFEAASACTPSEHREILEAQILTSLKALNAKNLAHDQKKRWYRLGRERSA